MKLVGVLFLVLGAALLTINLSAAAIASIPALVLLFVGAKLYDFVLGHDLRFSGLRSLFQRHCSENSAM